jgi:hypothetical protein
MRLRFFKLFLLASLLCGSFSSRLYGNGFGCDGVAGGVIFKDTLYGVLTGSLLTGLYLLSQDGESRDAVGPTLARGSALGGLAGLGLGIVEVTVRDCHEPSRSGESSGSVRPVFALQPKTEASQDAYLIGLDWRY